MLSPALRHKENRLAKAITEASADTLASSENLRGQGKSERKNDQFSTMLVSLDQDLSRLHDLESIDEKVSLKKLELLPKYIPHVDAYIQSGARYPNPLMVWCAIWSIDADDLETAMKLANYCIAQQQLAPEHFKRDLVTYFVEEVADWADRQHKVGTSASPYLDDVCANVGLNLWPTTNVIARGKIFKMAGIHAEANEEFKLALEFFKRAQEENDSAGCKGRIKKLIEKLDLSE